MQKLLRGLAEFQKNVRPAYREKFAQLALGQSPDCLFVACSDSRVVPNLFASTEPGDLFVMRNVGNIVPPCDASGHSRADLSEGAAVEFALLALNVRDVVVCGHSECGAMKAIAEREAPPGARNLEAWLDVARPALTHVRATPPLDPGLAPHDRLSQLNVLRQLDNLMTYPAVRERVRDGRLNLHAWWFDLTEVRVSSFKPELGRFTPVIDG